MGKVAVVYWSGTGNTQIMANCVVEGAKAAGADASLFTSANFDVSQMDQFDAVAFGCPSMGDEQLEESEFEPMFTSCKPKLKGKKIALFGSYGWGNGEWMDAWKNDCLTEGAVLACDCVICNETPDGEASDACKNLGKALA